jgi:hypothetical protein
MIPITALHREFLFASYRIANDLHMGVWDDKWCNAVMLKSKIKPKIRNGYWEIDLDVHSFRSRMTEEKCYKIKRGRFRSGERFWYIGIDISTACI